MKIVLENKDGKKVCELETEEAPYKFTLHTLWGDKEYSLNFNYYKDKKTKEKNLTMIKGAQLQ